MTTGQRVRAVRGAKPGLLSNLFIETCLLVATLGAMMVAPDELPSLSDIQSGAVDPDMIGDKLSEFHMQAGLTDCCIMLFKTKSVARLSARGMWQAPPGKFLAWSQVLPLILPCRVFAPSSWCLGPGLP